MTPEQQRIACAELDGWTKYSPGDFNPTHRWTNSVHAIATFDSLPDYLSDLNAVHALEEKIVTEDETKEFLLPCPCCGTSAHFGVCEDEESENWQGEYVECSNKMCGLTTVVMFPCKDEAKTQLAARWNNRAKAAQRVEAILRATGRWED